MKINLSLFYNNRRKPGEIRGNPADAPQDLQAVADPVRWEPVRYATVFVS